MASVGFDAFQTGDACSNVQSGSLVEHFLGANSRRRRTRRCHEEICTSLQALPRDFLAQPFRLGRLCATQATSTSLFALNGARVVSQWCVVMSTCVVIGAKSRRQQRIPLTTQQPAQSANRAMISVTAVWCNAPQQLVVLHSVAVGPPQLSWRCLW